MPAEKKLNPFDVEGLEKSLSDSAARVSTIWISYLLFGLYLLVTAGTATNKQLLLAEPIKLPALGTEVPLVSFFVLSPIFFVLLHFYVLLQTLLLGRTARAYDDALNRTLKKPEENEIFRERLANTIFAQIFSGAPRERKGWVGRVLRGIAWFTLVGSPILVLLTFQLAFLPYHSHEVTWVHRLLIFTEVVMALTLWPVVINPSKEFAWYRLDLRVWGPLLWSWQMTDANQGFKKKQQSVETPPVTIPTPPKTQTALFRISEECKAAFYRTAGFARKSSLQTWAWICFVVATVTSPTRS